MLFGVVVAGGCDHKGGATKRGDVEGAGACGGFAGATCPQGLVCADDPADDCDVKRGGADCAGICVEAEKPAAEQPAAEKPADAACTNPRREVVSTDPEKCAAIRFKCHDGQVAFFDDCGCGCETP